MTWRSRFGGKAETPVEFKRRPGKGGGEGVGVYGGGAMAFSSMTTILDLSFGNCDEISLTCDS